jgi:Transposase IS4
LALIVALSNRNILQSRRATTTSSEILKFFGLMLLGTKNKFTSRATLWNTEPFEKYEATPNFGQTGMGRNRFEDIISCIRFSDQPEERPAGMMLDVYRWRLVDDFVENFNVHRATFSRTLFVLMSLCLGGTGRVVNGLTWVSQPMWRLIESRRTGVRFRVRHVEGVASC